MSTDSARVLAHRGNWRERATLRQAMMNRTMPNVASAIDKGRSHSIALYSFSARKAASLGSMSPHSLTWYFLSLVMNWVAPFQFLPAIIS